MIEKSMKQKYKDGEIRCKDYADYCAKNAGYVDYNERSREMKHINGIQRPMKDCKGDGVYLGVFVAERVLSSLFDNVQRMQYGNSGYDFVCGKGYKIDVKSACLNTREIVNTYFDWNFRIKKNKIADYFLLLAFDNIDDLNPMHIWLIKGNEVIRKRKFNEFVLFSISDSILSMRKVEKYELKGKLREIIDCCNIMKKVYSIDEGNIGR